MLDSFLESIFEEPWKIRTLWDALLTLLLWPLGGRRGSASAFC